MTDIKSLVERLRSSDIGWEDATYAAIDAADLIEHQAARIAELERDAGRYRFLREKMGFTEAPGKQATMSFCGSIPSPNHNFHTDWVGDRFDASVDETIDAAIAAQAGSKEGE